MLLSINNNQIEYFEIGNVESKENIIVIPPGGFNFEKKSCLKFLQENLPEILTKRIIVFSYPGISNAPQLEDVTIPNISELYLQSVKKLKIEKCEALGISFGGSVLSVMVDKNPGIFSKIFVIASGEYLYFPRRQICSLFFLIANKNNFANHVIYFFLVKVFKIFSEISFNYLSNLIEMGKSVFNFKLSHKINNIEGSLIFLKNDFFVTKKGKDKLIKKFPNCEVFEIADVRHTKKLKKEEWVKIISFLKKHYVP